MSSDGVEWSDTALFSSAEDEDGSDEWATPRKYWDPIGRALGGFDLDAATSPDSPHTIAPVGFTEDDDALTKNWAIHGPDGDVDVWLNPPYSISEDFLEKALAEYQRDGVRSIIVLIPVRTDTGYYHDVIDHAALEVAVGQGRIEFIPMTESQNSSGNTFPSMYLFFGPDELAEELLPVFEQLGKPKRPVATSGPEQVGLEGWSQ